MSEVHDKIIADKEAKIADLDLRIKAKQESLNTLKDAFTSLKETTSVTASSFESIVSLLDVTNDLNSYVEMATRGINNSANNLLKVMRDTKSSMIFEAQQLKNVTEESKQFKYCASDLKSAVELINSIRPTIKELMNNPDELNVIKEIIHACQSTTENRKRSETCADKQTSTSPDVQVG